MINTKSFLRKVEGSRSKLIYLIQAQVEGRAAWYYVLTNQAKLPVLLEKCSSENPTALNLEKYGVVLDSGWGKEPPPHIKNKYSNDNSSGEQKGIEFFYLQSHDDNGRLYYAYVGVKADKAEEFREVSAVGGFYMSDYGVVIESGWGELTDEIMDGMEKKYGFMHDRELMADYRKSMTENQ